MPETRACAAFPPLLPPKGTVGIVAPSRWPSKEILEASVKLFEARGYEVVVHDQCYLQHGTLAGKDMARAEAINDMFADATIDAIFCARGGSGAMMVLDRLDYEMIASNPKPIIGMSDNTALLQAIISRAGFATYHGPVGYNFIPSNYEAYTEQDLFYMITGSQGERRLSFPMAEIERPGTACGRLVGGNMSLLQSLIGTSFDWSGEGAILFIEDVGEHLYRIERMMTHFRLAGKFDGIRAVMVGEMARVPEEKAEEMTPDDVPYGRTVKEIILKHIPPEIPVGFNFPCGHGRYVSTFPVGCHVQLAMGQNNCEMIVKI